MLAVIAIYLLFNLALLQVLPLPVIAISSLPVADAAALLFGAFGGQAITVLALLSLAGLINASIMGAPRILYGLSRDRLFAPSSTGSTAAAPPRWPWCSPAWRRGCWCCSVTSPSCWGWRPSST